MSKCIKSRTPEFELFFYGVLARSGILRASRTIKMEMLVVISSVGDTEYNSFVTIWYLAHVGLPERNTGP